VRRNTGHFSPHGYPGHASPGFVIRGKGLRRGDGLVPMSTRDISVLGLGFGLGSGGMNWARWQPDPHPGR
jgi:hypothetical protein